jgi:cysteinyl-tRNA synthetase
VDFSSEALEAAEKGFARLMNGLKDLKRIQPAKGSSPEITAFVKELSNKLYAAMNDDMQTPIVISELFEACHQVNLLVDRKAKISADDLQALSQTMHLWIEDILGLINTNDNGGENKALDKVMQMVLDIRAKAKADKDWATSDKIRDDLNEAGIIIKDTPDGAIWEI